jgi:heparin binding hemagglutinin HbhA
MATITDIRRTLSDSTPVLALVGATDAAVRQARHLIANATNVQAEIETRVTRLQEEIEKAVRDFDARQLQAKVAERLDPKALQATAQQVPALAVARALEMAGRAEAGYEGLAERGKVVVERVRTQQATQDLIKQGKVTVSRTKAAVTTARKTVDETANAALGVVKVGRTEANLATTATVAAAEEAVAVAEESVEAAAGATVTVAKQATTTARRSATNARSAARRATSSVRKTASSATRAAENTTEKLGKG